MRFTLMFMTNFLLNRCTFHIGFCFCLIINHTFAEQKIKLYPKAIMELWNENCIAPNAQPHNTYTILKNAKGTDIC